MTDLKANIAGFDRLRPALETDHLNEWVLFYDGNFIAAFADFEAAASWAVDTYGTGPYLIRQVGAGAVQMPGGMVFRPAHALGTGGL